MVLSLILRNLKRTKKYRYPTILPENNDIKEDRSWISDKTLVKLATDPLQTEAYSLKRRKNRIGQDFHEYRPAAT